MCCVKCCNYLYLVKYHNTWSLLFHFINNIEIKPHIPFAFSFLLHSICIAVFAGLGKSFREGNGNVLQYFAWGISWTEKPEGLQSRAIRVRYNLATKNSFNQYYVSFFWSIIFGVDYWLKKIIGISLLEISFFFFLFIFESLILV